VRVALVTPYSYTYPGGVGRHVEALARELSAQGHEARLLAPYDPDDRLARVLHRGAAPERRGRAGGDIDHHHILGGHHGVIDAGGFDHQHAAGAVDGADVAPGQGDQIMFWQCQVGFQHLPFEIVEHRFLLYCRMARCLSGLRIRFACIAGWRVAYPAYGFISPVLPDGALLIRPTGSFCLYCRMARCLSGVVVL